MASKGGIDVIILHGRDAHEWSRYLVDLFQDLIVYNYEVISNNPIEAEDLEFFKSCKCILILLSRDLLCSLYIPDVLEVFQEVLKPPKKVVVLLCEVTECENFTDIFADWPKWKQLSYEDESELYINAVRNAITEDSGCDSVTDTDAECDDENPIYSRHLEYLHQPLTQEKHGNLIAVQPERIRCGEKTQLYIILKCKLDSQIKNEVNFNPINGPSVRFPATLQNEYILSVDAPDFPSGPVYLKVFSGDLVICEAKITYYTDMEEISNLLLNATNPIEFMCQAFKIVPYNTEALDKLLTESLKNNIPASGIHLFGINQIEEENLSANQRDEELPTLLHFSAKYGLKNLTAVLLTCPGALQAYSVANKHGDFPNNMAEKHGYKDLRQFIDEYVETADMLRTHIKEELMYGGGGGADDDDDNNPTYESMASFSTDLLMKCSLNPGCADDIYESMAGFVPQYNDEETYMDMMQAKGASASTDGQRLSANDSVIRKILEDTIDYSSDEEDPYHLCKHEDVYDVVERGSLNSELGSRPPVPVPRPEEPQDMESYISKVFPEKTQVRKENIYVESVPKKREVTSIKIKRDRPQSSVYDPFVGMKTPGQRELITLQEHVKLGMVSVDEALLQFKEWQLNQKRRSDSFRYQQENLKKLRDSINRRRNENKKRGKKSDLEITKPIRRGQNTETKPEFAVYESYPRMPTPSRKEITRGNWKTDSTSSTTSSASNRSSTRSTLSISSGMEGDNEDNEGSEQPQRQNPRHSLTEHRPPPRPPRIPTQSPIRFPPTTSDNKWNPPPVPPRGR
ncbi:phosphoinositide 3-kinase adapter protein 1 isoform X2 [Spea bombifrons]|uniref:phosphoinositide 3-kinase adapter protein 1 isoform X2 n=1 Tax=Spea bombifrons TaxID=233779 RepID=UPI00234A9B5F|nr:phosphoinositide 3-kinase adapter protein 1 isoform X2 [Spea bombifrons]